MTEAHQPQKPKAKTAAFDAPKFETPKFETPKFEMPSFDMPRMEIPAAFREFAEKGASQAKETYEKMKAAAEEVTDVLEDTYANAAKGYADYGLKLIEATRVNTNAAFDFYAELMSVKSYSDVIELSTTHVRKQFEAVSAQTKDLAAVAQRMATETTEPMKGSVSKVFAKVS